MEFNHLQLYVSDLAAWHRRFVQIWGGYGTKLSPTDGRNGVLIYLGQVPLLITTPQSADDAAATYLGQHPAGIGDIAFRVKNLDSTLSQALTAGGKLLKPVQTDALGRGRWCQIQGWGSLRHTLVESDCPALWVPGQVAGPGPAIPNAGPAGLIAAIDHAVLNVPTGQLTAAITWYTQQLGFWPQQQFTIDTAWSGLRSQVLAHPNGGAQLPINEPSTANSQVQEFLDWNRGAGIQHVALHTSDILQTVHRLRQAGVTFLEVPDCYYADLSQRQGYRADPELEAAIARLKILVDWEPNQPQTRLLQTFTHPFLEIPTLFFELIQRQTLRINDSELRAEGFGERNFQALFEAIEQEQLKRGSLI
ncbi:MAG: 4-hydroxyphenylpyruvate dioxygenase [Leptolyngbyaceae cyanobacterium SM2_5_2]|nr:4-hydroxyphenylpyruvate dioxygenase [Leptolyngbyaceae cyanobacterium SM2_5_2]